MTDSQLGSDLEDSSSRHGQVKLDIHMLESLFGECLRALTKKRIEVVARYFVKHFTFFTRDMMDCHLKWLG